MRISTLSRPLALLATFAVLAVLLAAAAALAPAAPALAQGEGEPLWYEPDAGHGATVHFYFFWSETCPHCREAHPFIDELERRYPWLELHSLELNNYPENVQKYVEMAASLGEQAQYVPAFFYCGRFTSGYDSAETTGRQLVAGLEACYEEALAAVGDTAGESAGAAAPGDTAALPAAAVSLPFLGEVEAAALSLPLLTVVIAGVDAFNPCAFFVLMFLLSLMVHARSRRRMLLIGGVFVFFSGLIYFLFMAAWLNVWQWVGELRAITVAAGLVAVVIGAINVKDFFWFQRGVSLTIPEKAKPDLYQRMRNLVKATSLPAMLAGTAALAIAANSYELVCTAGFPMLYTHILTQRELPAATYYLYLALYNLIYILPLLAIVVLFTMKFGARKLSEEEGRGLKLVSGLMMLALGGMLLFFPEMLNQVWASIALLGGALALAALIIVLHRRRRPAQPPARHTRRGGPRPRGA